MLLVFSDHILFKHMAMLTPFIMFATGIILLGFVLTMIFSSQIRQSILQFFNL